MSRFLEDAMGIFETASAASPEGAGDVAILIDDAGALRVVDASGWRPEALQSHYGARTVYQVTRSAGSVRVAGRSGGQTCVLETSRPSAVFQPVFPRYSVACNLLP